MAITKGVAALAGSTYGNANTKYVVSDKDGKWTVYTGYANVPTFEDKTTNTPAGADDRTDYVAVIDTNKLASVVFVNHNSKATPTGKETKETVYVLSTDKGMSVAADGSTTYTFSAIVNGEKKSLVYDSTSAITLNVGLNEVKYEDGKVDTLTPVKTGTTPGTSDVLEKNDTADPATGYAIEAASNGIITISSIDTTKYTYGSDLKVYVISGTDVEQVGADYDAGNYKRIVAVTAAYGNNSATDADYKTIVALYLADVVA